VKRAFAIVLVLLLLLVLIFYSRKTRTLAPSQANREIKPSELLVTETAASSRPASNQSAPLVGEIILRDYAKTNLSPQDDLRLMSHLMENSLLLLKSAANRPLSANEDWAALFKGQNAAHERFLPDTHTALNPKGQLVDRWETPLFFHALGQGRFELRSAGPDKILWTSDDIHRNPDGSFRQKSDLNPQALFRAK
jgi:hypothetical protein